MMLTMLYLTKDNEHYILQRNNITQVKEVKREYFEISVDEEGIDMHQISYHYLPSSIYYISASFANVFLCKC
jgi:hypothetical protein